MSVEKGVENLIKKNTLYSTKTIQGIKYIGTTVGL